MVLFVLRKPMLHTRMHSHLMGLDVWLLVGPFVYFHTLCVWTAKALTRLRVSAGSPEPSLVAYAISTIISWADVYTFCIYLKMNSESYDRFSEINFQNSTTQSKNDVGSLLIYLATDGGMTIEFRMSTILGLFSGYLVSHGGRMNQMRHIPYVHTKGLKTNLPVLSLSLSLSLLRSSSQVIKTLEW